MFGIVSAVDESYFAVAGGLENGLPCIGIGGEFGAVAFLEFGPLFWIVGKPLAKLGAGCDILEPGVHDQINFFDTARPEAFYEVACAIFLCRGIVRSLDFNHDFYNADQPQSWVEEGLRGLTRA